MRVKKLQIALEFMVIFAFVLLVFMFLFVIISSQRAQTLSSQIFSEEQLVAQSIAAQLDRALQAGNGYTASVPVTSAIGTLSYQLLITKSGAVIVNASVGSEVLQAIAYSSARSVQSNAAYLQPGTFYYSLPIGNGTIRVQNAFGTICIDYTCPTTSTQANNLTLSAQVVRAALFANPAAYVQGSANVLPYGNNAITILAWVRTSANSRGTIFSYGSTSYPGNGVAIGAGGQGTNGNFIANFSSDTAVSKFSVNDGKWHLVGIGYPANPANPKSINFFVDNSVYLATLPSTPAIVPGTLYHISRWMTTGTGNTGAYPLNGLIANIQVYNQSLTSTQVTALYSQGIAAAPVANSNSVGWWPLNGDLKDYSGYNYSGVQQGGVLFPTVAELFAKVTNQQGYALPGALVGFASTLGNFTSSQTTTNVTNANGIAVAFLTTQQKSGQAMVQAVAYNGNQSLQSSLIGWWPLSLNSGGASGDVSGYADTGTLGKDTGWTNPNFVASFRNGFAQIPPSVFLQPSSQSWSFWFYSSALATSQRIFGVGKPQISPYNGIEAYIAANQILGFNALGQSCETIDPILNSTWYQAAATWDGSTLKCYLNGMLENSIAIGASSGVVGTNGFTYLGTDSFTPAKYFFNGKIANFQTYNTVLGANTILQLYNHGIASTPANALGWWPLNGDVNDYSGNGNNGSAIGAVSFVSSPINSSISNNATGILVANLNGVNSMITSPLAQTADSAFTLTAWVNPANTLQMTSGTGYSVFNSLSTNAFEVILKGGSGLGAKPGGGNVQLGIGTNFYPGYGINNGSWNFLAFAISNGKASLYANGAQPYNITIASGPYSINALSIAQIVSGSPVYNGLMANVQLYNRTLSSAQVYQIFQQGIAGVPLNSTSTNYKLLGWWPLNGDDNDYSGSGNNATSSNVIFSSQGALAQALPTPFASSGVNFNGQGSYINVSATGTLRPCAFPVCGGGTGLTLNAWVRINGTSHSANPFIIDSSGDLCANCGGYALILTNYATPEFFIDTFSPANYYIDNSLKVLNNNWHMLTADYNETNSMVYIDGINVNSIPYTGLITYAPNCNGKYCNFTIGSSDDFANNFAGSISDVQVYNTGLTAAQVANLYKSQSPPSASLLLPLGWYP